MANEMTLSKLNEALDWAYDKAMNGIPGTGTALEFAQEYRRNNDTILDAANSLIRWQNTKAATSGFLTGLGGIITLPVAVPANVASVMYVQLRMITAIAYLGGYDPRDDRVKALVYTCLAGNAAKDILKDVGVVMATKLATNYISKISGATLVKINQAVGFRLLTKFGTTGAINLGKAVPLLGGLVGAAFDSVTTNTVGNVARDLFAANPAPKPTAAAKEETFAD
ncbi:EcsC family protein [Pseudomonas sp. SID14000]|uniref:EcsC family protein n=1 Tax=Pseudomonas sp. SID14000 TaxID=1986221 RepID=UPI000B3C472D|nr:EcsC family protein [Pseudomonas sp. SID14000]